MSDSRELVAPPTVSVVMSESCNPALQADLRRFLLQYGVDARFTTDNDKDNLAAITQSDLTIVCDSDLTRVDAWRSGFAVGSKAFLYIVNFGNNPITAPPGFHSDHRFLEYPLPEGQDLGTALLARLMKFRTDPDSFRTIHATPISPPSRTNVFVSYSHADTNYLERLLVHLKPTERDGRLTLFSDKRIEVGDDWRSRLEAELEAAAVAILLVSADFLASDFIVEHELQPLLQAAQDRGVRILPVVLRPCRFTRDPELSRIQAFRSASPMSDQPFEVQEAYWDEVAQEVERCLGPGPS